MRRALLTITVLSVVALSSLAPKRADAFGLRLGDLSIVRPYEDSLFAIGIDKDFQVIPYLAINSGSLFAVDGDKLYIDAYFGLKVLIPVAMGGRLKVTVRGDFLFKAFYPFEQNIVDYGLAIGGIVGPGLIIGVAGPLSLTFDMDIQFYKFVYPDNNDERFTIALAFLGGIRF